MIDWELLKSLDWQRKIGPQCEHLRIVSSEDQIFYPIKNYYKFYNRSVIRHFLFCFTQLAQRARGVVHVMLNGTRQHFVDKQIFPAFMDDRWGDPGDFA